MILRLNANQLRVCSVVMCICALATFRQLLVCNNDVTMALSISSSQSPQVSDEVLRYSYSPLRCREI